MIIYMNDIVFDGFNDGAFGDHDGTVIRIPV